MLFSIYDEDGSGALSYKEFSDGVFGRPSTSQSQKGGSYNASAGGSQAGAASRDPEALAEALK